MKNSERLDRFMIKKMIGNVAGAKILTTMTGKKTSNQNLYAWRTDVCQPNPFYWMPLERFSEGAVPANKWKKRTKPKGSGR